MDFLLKVIISFFVGGFYVSGVIWLSEKLGSKIGGAIAGLPSTILISLIFICITEGSNQAQQASTVVPLLFIASLVYAIVFIEVENRMKNDLLALGVAVIAWVIWALVFRSFYNFDYKYIVLISFASLLFFTFAFRKMHGSEPKKIPHPKHIFALRFLMGATVISSAVIAARLAGPVWGGIIGSLPGMLGNVLYFLNKSQGYDFLKGFVKRLPLSYFSSFTFLVIVHQTLTKINPVISFLLGMGAALIYTSALLALKQKSKLPN